MSTDLAPTLDVVVPVHNEQSSLEGSLRELHATLSALLSVTWIITVADNASTDDTAEVAKALAAELPGIRVLRLEKKGRGHALKIAWLLSEATVLAYVDADLSTDLRALPPLIAPLLSGHSDIAIGTRLLRTSRVVRGAKREFISRSYNALLRSTMGVGFTDAQCGFKAMRRDVARTVLPYVYDTDWFFDTELLVIAERAALRIHEVPVDWVDDPQSSVNILATAWQDLHGLARITRSIAVGTIPVESIYAELGRKPLDPPHPPSFFGQVIRFLAVGGLSTVAFALLYVVLAMFIPAQAANFTALLVTAVANTAANRRFTFGVRGRARFARHHLQGLLVFALSWMMTAGSLALVHLAWGAPGVTAEVIALTIANLAATAVRFVLLRTWVFRAEPVVESTSRSEVIRRQRRHVEQVRTAAESAR